MVRVASVFVIYTLTLVFGFSFLSLFSIVFFECNHVNLKLFFAFFIHLVSLQIFTDFCLTSFTTKLPIINFLMQTDQIENVYLKCDLLIFSVPSAQSRSVDRRHFKML